jgi:hypothetical protein
VHADVLQNLSTQSIELSEGRRQRRILTCAAPHERHDTRQVEANVKAGEWRLTAEELAEVDVITK